MKTTSFSYINDASVNLNLSLPECLIEFCEVTPPFESADESYDVTIQIKALCLFLHMALFVFQLGHLVEICFRFNLAVKGLNEVCLHRTYLFLKELVIVSDVFLLALLSHENLHSLPEVV